MRNPPREYGLFGWNYAHLLTHPWKIIEESYYRVKWFVQRGWRGYADCDVWSIDGYLMGWLPKALRVLRDNKLGHPIGMTVKGWHMRLERMADGFDAGAELCNLRYSYKSVGERNAKKRFHRGMKLFHEHFFSLWD